MLKQLFHSSVDGHLTSLWSVTVRDGCAVGNLECVFWVCWGELHHAAFLEEVYSEIVCDMSLRSEEETWRLKSASVKEGFV